MSTVDPDGGASLIYTAGQPSPSARAGCVRLSLLDGGGHRLFPDSCRYTGRSSPASPACRPLRSLPTSTASTSGPIHPQRGAALAHRTPPPVLSREATNGRGPVGETFLRKAVPDAQVTLSRVHAHRILHEALTTGADPLDLRLLFDIAATTATRYAATARASPAASAGDITRAISQPVPPVSYRATVRDWNRWRHCAGRRIGPACRITASAR